MSIYKRFLIATFGWIKVGYAHERAIVILDGRVTFSWLQNSHTKVTSICTNLMDTFRPWYLKKLQMISFTTVTDALLLAMKHSFHVQKGYCLNLGILGHQTFMLYHRKGSLFSQYGLFLSVGSFGSKVFEQFCHDFSGKVPFLVSMGMYIFSSTTLGY